MPRERRAATVWSAVVASLVFVVVAGAPGGTADAQGCAQGRVVTEQTAGRCCWPGQHWNDEVGRCDGAPSCPEGTGGAGSTCVPLPTPAVAAPPSVAAAASPNPQPLVAPPPTAPPPLAGSPGWSDDGPARFETEPSWGLVGTGLSLFFTGWLPMVVVGTVQLAIGGACDGWGAASYVPLLGAAVASLGGDLCLSYRDDRGFLYAAGYVSSGLQILGFVLLVVGLASRRSRRVYDAAWEVAPGTRLGFTSAPGGAGVSLRF